MNDITRMMLTAGWVGMLAGVVSGAVIGLFFHRDAWMGGYGSFRRRMARLGHISFFGLGFVNLFFALTHQLIPSASAQVASMAFLVGAVTMPACCFLTAWRKEPFRHLFFIPVLGVTSGIVLTLSELWRAS